MRGGLPHLSGLPHLPGVPYLHVNRPLDWQINNFARTPRFSVHFFAIAGRLQRESA